MLQIDIKMPKNCRECLMNHEHLMCSCMYYIVKLKDEDRAIRDAIELRYRPVYDDRPIWCPLKEVNDDTN